MKAASDYQPGWYQNGNTYRFVIGHVGRLYITYQTKNQHDQKMRTYTGGNLIDPNVGNWFEHATYLGQELSPSA